MKTKQKPDSVMRNILCPNCKKIVDYEEYTDDRGYLKKRKCKNCNNEYQYPSNNNYDITDQYAYVRTCKCGKSHILTTQQDRNPEYYTSVGLLCECGEMIFFELPVN